MIERQITGQMSISDVLGEWEKTKRAAEAAMQEAEKRRLEAARKKALKETEEIMDRLKDIGSGLEAGGILLFQIRARRWKRKRQARSLPI